mmetsp:Transcript_26542/g.80069  ORF Transcript_26542/g.80069 Transcript_26542/m.80069 type:complete len:91 (-) Transcript_26542:236-508(-)
MTWYSLRRSQAFKMACSRQSTLILSESAGDINEHSLVLVRVANAFFVLYQSVKAESSSCTADCLHSRDCTSLNLRHPISAFIITESFAIQ